MREPGTPGIRVGRHPMFAVAGAGPGLAGPPAGPRPGRMFPGRDTGEGRAESRGAVGPPDR